MEWWSDGVLDSITPSLHHSITPSLHHSITPSLHHSITPSLHHPNTPLPLRAASLVSAMHDCLRLRTAVAALFFGAALHVVAAPSPIQEQADRFLGLANAGYQGLYRVNSEAQWLAVTDVTPEHDAAAEATGKAYAAFNGNPALITEARELLTHQKELTEITVRQLKQLLLNAAEGPMTNPDLVSKRVEAETKQASILNSFEFKLNG